MIGEAIPPRKRNRIRATNYVEMAHNRQAKEETEDDQVVPKGRRRRTFSVGEPPPQNTPLPQLWDHAAWQKRIRDRLEQLGSPAQTLLRDVGGQSDEIRTQLNPKNKGSGPNINIIMRIAKALQWTIGQAVGTEDPTLMLANGDQASEIGKRKGQIDPQKLQWALCFVDQYYIETTGSDNRYIEKGPGYAEAVNVIYSLLSEEESEGRSPDPEQNPTLRLAIRNLLRHL